MMRGLRVPRCGPPNKCAGKKRSTNDGVHRWDPKGYWGRSRTSKRNGEQNSLAAGTEFGGQQPKRLARPILATERSSPALRKFAKSAGVIPMAFICTTTKWIAWNSSAPRVRSTCYLKEEA